MQRTKSARANPVYYVLGQTAAGRYLFCVVMQFPDGKGFRVTAAELAQFWDTHDLTDFADELEEMYESIFERREEGDLHVNINYRR